MGKKYINLCFHTVIGHKKHGILKSIGFGNRKHVFQLCDLEHGYIQVYDSTNHIEWEILKVEVNNVKSQSEDVNFKIDHQ